MAKHRAGSENAGGSPQEVTVFLSSSHCLPTTRGLLRVSTSSSVTRCSCPHAAVFDPLTGSLVTGAVFCFSYFYFVSKCAPTYVQCARVCAIKKKTKQANCSFQKCGFRSGLQVDVKSHSITVLSCSNSCSSKWPLSKPLFLPLCLTPLKTAQAHFT